MKNTRHPKIIKPYSDHKEKWYHRPDKPENTQHLYPLGAGWTNNAENKVMRYESFHNQWHGVFGTLPPHLQLLRVLELNQQVWGVKYKRELLKAMDVDDEQYIYKNGIYIKR